MRKGQGISINVIIIAAIALLILIVLSVLLLRGDDNIADDAESSNVICDMFPNIKYHEFTNETEAIEFYYSQQLRPRSFEAFYTYNDRLIVIEMLKDDIVLYNLITQYGELDRFVIRTEVMEKKCW